MTVMTVMTVMTRGGRTAVDGRNFTNTVMTGHVQTGSVSGCHGFQNIKWSLYSCTIRPVDCHDCRNSVQLHSRVPPPFALSAVEEERGNTEASPRSRHTEPQARIEREATPERRGRTCWHEEYPSVRSPRQCEVPVSAGLAEDRIWRHSMTKAWNQHTSGDSTCLKLGINTHGGQTVRTGSANTT